MLVFIYFLSVAILCSPVLGQGRNVGGGKAECPLLSGVYVSVMRRIFNPGIHKQLLTEVEIMLTTTLLPDKCQLLVEETIPRGAYVDTDELRDLRTKTGLRSFVPARVDIEKPEFESEAYRVFLFRELVMRENLRVTTVQVPLHMRYHRPALAPAPTVPGTSGEHPTATVKIQNPRLLLSCQGEDLSESCPGRVVTAVCDESGRTKCDWINLPYKINVASVEVSVPVGNSEHAPLVVGVTTLVTCGAAIYLVVTMFRQVKQKTD